MSFYGFDDRAGLDMARHLRRGARYMVQMDLIDFDDPPKLTPEGNSWEMEQEELKVRTQWFGRSFDAANRLETQICRFAVLAGPSPRGLGGRRNPTCARERIS